MNEAQDKKRVKKDLAAAGLVLALSVLATALAAGLNADLRITSLFHEPGKGFPLGSHQPWSFLYHWGTLPGLLLAFACLAGLVGVHLGRVRSIYRKPMLVFVLTTFLASGLLVNGILKPFWGRPRPCQAQEFGGEWEYRKVWPPGEPGRGRSFPSGHASMGFIPMALYAFVRVRPRFAKAALGLGLGYGLLMGAARVIQGDHFATDVLWSFATMAVTGLALDAFIPEEGRGPGRKHAPRWRRLAGLSAAAAAALVVLALFLTARPFYEQHRRYLWLGDKVREIVLVSNVSFTSRKVLFQGEGKPRILVDARGFGSPWARWRLCAVRAYPPGKLVYVYNIGIDGYLSELFYQATVILPRDLEGKVSVRFQTRSDFPFYTASDS